MHHFIVRSLGILVCWMMLIFISVVHMTHTYVIAATKLRALVMVCIQNIKNFMLGWEVSQIFNFGLGVFNFQYSGINLSWGVMLERGSSSQGATNKILTSGKVKMHRRKIPTSVVGLVKLVRS